MKRENMNKSKSAGSTGKISRNDPCFCGSGKKYKKCCMGKTEPPQPNLKSLYRRKYNIRLKNETDIQKIAEAGKLTIELLDLVESAIEPGITTEEINRIVHTRTLQAGARPAPLNYKGFPKSCCTSVNEVICHGIPGDLVLKDGDIVNVDITPILDGYYADASKTFYVGTPGEDARKIVETAAKSLAEGMAAAKPGNTLGDIGWAVQKYAESRGCSVVREFVGHGTGIDFHESPQVLHYGRPKQGISLVPGMVFTIEPMINLGKRHLYVLDDNWTAVTQDGSLSAQFEQTICITEDGYISLTPFDL